MNEQQELGPQSVTGLEVEPRSEWTPKRAPGSPPHDCGADRNDRGTSSPSRGEEANIQEEIIRALQADIKDLKCDEMEGLIHQMLDQERELPQGQDITESQGNWYNPWTAKISRLTDYNRQRFISWCLRGQQQAQELLNLEAEAL